MKRALGFLIFGVLAIGAVYLSVTRLSPFTEAQESGTGVTDVAVVESSPTFIPSPTLLPSPTLIPATVAPPTLPPPPTFMPSPTVELPTATLEPTIVLATEAIMPTATLPIEITAVTEEVVAADALAVMVTSEVLPTGEPALDTSAVVTVQPTVEFTPVMRDDGQASMPVNTGDQLSVGTPIVQPPLLPTATIEVVQPTSIPVEVQPTIEAPLFPTATIEIVEPTSIPVEVQPTIESTLLPTQAPTAEVSPVPALAQITGTISKPLAADLVLTLPDGTTMNATTAADGTFAFADLQPGSYHLQASAAGYLTSQIDFDLADGQSLVLPSALLRPGDTNHDNLVDVHDAVLIAANFGGPAVSPETDLNRDGTVDIRDLTLLGAAFGQSGPTSWG